MAEVTGIQPLSEEFDEYRRDESRSVGEADAIAFPTCEDDVVQILRRLRLDAEAACERPVPVTVQGARTGLAAGAVPHGGLVLNLSRMNRYLGMRRADDGTFLLRVQPGVVLSDLRKKLAKGDIPSAGWDAASLSALEQFEANSSSPRTPRRPPRAWAAWPPATRAARAATATGPCART